MSTTHRPPADDTTTINITLFLRTLPSASKSHPILGLTSHCHIAIRVETYTAQTGVTLCYNNHVCANWSSFPAFCSVGTATCTMNARKRAKQNRYQHAAIASMWTERSFILQPIMAAGTPRKGWGREIWWEITDSEQD
jgi:hypothetical protein